MPASSTRRAPYKIKLALFAGSLLLALCVLELSLRAVGCLFYSREEAPSTEVPTSPGRRKVTLLATGDSFTFGGEGLSDLSYPAHLQGLLDARFPDRRYAVINKGHCESTSTKILRNLPRMLEEHRPSMLILLVGSANRFSPWDNPHDEERGLLAGLRGWILELRTSKMARIIYWNLKGKSISWRQGLIRSEGIKEEMFRERQNRWNRVVNRLEVMARPQPWPKDDPVAEAWRLFSSGEKKRALELASGMAARTGGQSALARCILAVMRLQEGDLDGAGKTINGALADFPDIDEVRSFAAYVFGERASHFLKSGRYAEAMVGFLETIGADPGDDGSHYALTRTFELQSRHDAAFVLQRLERIRDKNPEAVLSRLFLSTLAAFGDMKGWEERAARWLRRDLEEIVRLCADSHVRLVLQTYPVSYPLANNVLRAVAREHRLPLVDNLSFFRTLAPRETYIQDLDHCTGEGYSKMAANVLGLICPLLTSRRQVCR